MEKAIKIRNLNKSINGKKILNNINLDVFENEIVGLVGPNGAGKSTLLKIMSGLYTYDEGDIYYFNYNFKNDFEKCMSIIGTLIEYPDLYKNLSGKKNLELFSSMFKGISEESIREIVKIVEMEKFLGKKFKTYSLGMKERLGVACALLNKPKILLLDEPTNGLDPVGISNIIDMLKNMKDTTIIISSHMLNEIESLCNKIVFINNGEIVNVKHRDVDDDKRNVKFEVDDYSKARIILNGCLISDELEVYGNDEYISAVNKELIKNGINVYRIYEDNNLEKEFFDMVKRHDEVNQK